MGQKDTITKDYMKDSRIFADAFNYFIYDGEQVIKPEKLHTLDTTMISIPHSKSGEGKAVEKHRDVFKYLTAKKDDSAVYLLLGIENQSDIHYAMPVRNMVYDGLQYAFQVERTAKLHREERKSGLSNNLKKKPTSGEYLSGFYKQDKLIPVVTLVIYFGCEEWDGPKSLHEMFEEKEAKVLSIVPDYKINLIDPTHMTEDEINRLNTSLREVLLFIKYSKDKKRLLELLSQDEGFKDIERQAVRVINVVTNSDLKVEESEGESNMCQALDEIKEDFKNEGLREGRREGRREGLREGRREERKEMAMRMLRKNCYSYEEIAEMTLLDIVEIKELDRK